MSDTLMREIIASGSAALGEFAKAAKTTGEHLYAVIVRQQFVEGISTLICLTLWILVNVLVLKGLYKWQEKKVKKDRYSDANVGAVCISMVFVVLSFIVFSIIQTAMQQILNPEFYAIQFIFNSVKGN